MEKNKGKQKVVIRQNITITADKKIWGMYTRWCKKHKYTRSRRLEILMLIDIDTPEARKKLDRLKNG